MNSYNEQGNFDFLDVHAVLAFVVQLMDYEATLTQVGNNQILNELRSDMEEFRIQNDEIMKLLDC